MIRRGTQFVSMQQSAHFTHYVPINLTTTELEVFHICKTPIQPERAQLSRLLCF